MRRLVIASIIMAATLIFASCTTTTGTTESSYAKAQVINVQSTDWRDAQANIPPTAIIQPEDLVTSPVIDITTLKAETKTTTASVRSSTLEQEAQKEVIKSAVEANPLADTTLKEDYSDGFLTTPKGSTSATEGKTSGQLASQATSDSFVYIDSTDAFRGAIAEYDYVEGMIYEVITSPNAITDIRLKPGENIASSPIVNDGGASWQFTMGTSIENGIAVQHLFVKPTTVGLDTSMIILTDQRTYYFRIASFPKSYMTALRFRYPAATSEGYFVAEDFESYIEEAKTNVAEADSFTVDLNTVDYGYQIKVSKGKPVWTPQLVFSTDTKTFIQLPPSIMTSMDMPSVYVVRDKTETLVNWRMKGNMYQIDTVITTNESIRLKSGEKEQVTIIKK